MKKITRVLIVRPNNSCSFALTFFAGEDLAFQTKRSYFLSLGYDIEIYTLVSGVLTLTHPLSKIVNHD